GGGGGAVGQSAVGPGLSRRSVGSWAAVPGPDADQSAATGRDGGRHLVLLPAGLCVAPGLRSVRLRGAGRPKSLAHRHGGVDAELVALSDLSTPVAAACRVG